MIAKRSKALVGFSGVGKRLFGTVNEMTYWNTALLNKFILVQKYAEMKVGESRYICSAETQILYALLFVRTEHVHREMHQTRGN